MRYLNRILSGGACAALLAAGVTAPAGTPAQAATPVTAQAAAQAAQSFNYAEALQKSIMFYEAQQSGRKPAFSRVEWRGDATVNDGKSAGVDLSKGWYDAGDHVKFGFPGAFAATMIAWGVVENRAGFANSGQLTAVLDNLRWQTDYLVAAHPSANTLYVQVGDGGIDHSYWGPPETIEALGMSRPVYKITASCPGTDVAAETAAALAASSLAFRATDPAYADTLLTHARQLFTFADSTKGTNGQDTAYVKCVPEAQGYYNSVWEGGGGAPGATKMYWDELAWAAVWLDQATGDAAYLTKAREFYPKMGSEPDADGNWDAKVPAYTFGLGWNDKQYGVYALMARRTGEQRFADDVQRYLDYWTVGYKGKKGQITPGGLAFVFYWGSLRMAMNTAWVALVYADHLGTTNPLYARYHDFAKRQVDYALGANPGNHSYMVGFGVNPPKRVHHRAASGQWLGYLTNDPPDNRHVIYGALAGGPNASDAWVDDREDYQRNEVAVDFNAGITAALGRLTHEYGGTPVPTSQLVDPVRDAEMLVDVISYHSGSYGAGMAITITNKSGWPPRILDKGTARYYFTLDGSTTIAQVKVSASDSNGCAVKGPFPHSGNVYYAEIDCTGKAIFPGSSTTFQRTTQLNVSVSNPGTWDATNDWSAGSASKVPLYDNGALVWGTEPA